MKRPTKAQMEVTKWRCAVLSAAGCLVQLSSKKDVFGKSPKICVFRDGKCYKFADPDWDVVNKQLGCLVNVCAMS